MCWSICNLSTFKIQCLNKLYSSMTKLSQLKNLIPGLSDLHVLHQLLQFAQWSSVDISHINSDFIVL